MVMTSHPTCSGSIRQGQWVLLHNAHNSPRLLAALDSFMHETKVVDPEFRLWVSVQPHPDIPSALLQSAVKVMADSPKVRWIILITVLLLYFAYFSIVENSTTQYIRGQHNTALQGTAQRSRAPQSKALYILATHSVIQDAQNNALRSL